MTLERGAVLHKRYRIEEILGQGGMGSVYRALDENLGVDVAVKENLFTTDEYARQFRLEAVILANLRHPNLPRVSDHFVMGEQGQYLVMDFIEGEDLRQRMERLGTISEEDAVQIGASICDALQYLHTRKPSILHRDIKPGNVKITPDGHIYLVDFGLAKVVQGSQVTTTGARAMTPGYSPPEQYGTARTDPRTDVYSLGATLYAALCGIIPEDGLARAMDNADLTPLRRRNPRISRRVSAVIEKAMAVDPADRYQSAEDFKRALLGSKQQTERITGRYTVAPPPMEGRDTPRILNEVATSDEPRGSSRPVPPLPTLAEDEKPFVPPGKRLIAKQKARARRRRAWILFLLILAASLVGVLYFNPSMIPVQARGLLPFLVPASTSTPTPTLTPQPTATLTETPAPTATATRLSPTATFTSTVTARPSGTQALVPVVTAKPTITPTPTATPQGGGYGQLVFASDRSGVPQLYLTDLSGQEPKQITDIPEGACQPAWSPDGQRLVFVSPCAGPDLIGRSPLGDTRLFIINADGTQLTPLPTVAGGDFEPAWSPDGSRIAFTSLRDGNMQIYVLSLKDQSVTRLTNLGAGAEARQAAWSATGDAIAFTARRMTAYQVWVMSAAGQNAQQVIHSGQDYWDYFPVWLKNGQTLLFSQRRAASYGPAWQMSIPYEDGAALDAIRLELGRLPVERVSVSPDGLWILFQGEDQEDNPDIFVEALTGTGRTRLTSDRSQDFDPVWRPIAAVPARSQAAPQATSTP